MPFGRQRSVHSPFSSIPRVCPHVNELKVKLARYVVHRSHKYLLKNKRKQPLHRLSVCLSLSIVFYIQNTQQRDVQLVMDDRTSSQNVPNSWRLVCYFLQFLFHFQVCFVIYPFVEVKQDLSSDAKPTQQ